MSVPDYKRKLIMSLISILKEQGITPGKIQIQKYCYFLSKKGISVPYQFEVYKFGPFSSELHSDLSSLIFSRDLKEVEENTLHINPEKEAMDVDSDVKDKIHGIVKTFKSIIPSDTFQDYEVYGTVFYCMNALSRLKKKVDVDSVFSEFKGWKGSRYTKDQVAEAFLKLQTTM